VVGATDPGGLPGTVPVLVVVRSARESMNEHTDTPDDSGNDEGVSHTENWGGNVDFVDEVPDQIMSKVGTVKRVEPQRPHHDLSGFAVNTLPGGGPPGFVEDVVGWFEDRYDVDRFDHDEVVGVVIVDADDPGTVFPVGLWDTIAFRTEPVENVAADVVGDVAEGDVAVIGRSGTLRVRGVGAVDVEPTDVVEVTERYDGVDD